MYATLLRLLVTGWILVTLVRAGRGAWSHRRLVLLVWSRIRPRHLLAAALLASIVIAIAGVLVSTVPGMDLGLGSLLGTSSNAVFTPLEEAVAHSGPPPASGPDWSLILITSGFLLPLLALLPWLAFVEEEVFRAGLEDASPRREAVAALVFGLAHMVMLVPLGAALAVGVAGFVYGRVYRSAYVHGDGREVPLPVLRSYRQTKRARAAAARARRPTRVGPSGAVGLGDLRPERRQAVAVLASTVWHTTFNSLIVGLIWVMIVLDALST